MGTPKRVASGVSVESIAIAWAVPRSVVNQWIDEGLIGRTEAGVVDRNGLLQFIESEAGQVALRASRGA